MLQVVCTLQGALTPDAVCGGVSDSFRLVLPIHCQGAHDLERGGHLDGRGLPPLLSKNQCV